MEMNTRLQVEHPVTEAVTGEDLVAWQFKIAAGEPLPLTQEEIAQRIRERGWAFEARIYAENPAQNFMPDAGTLLRLRTPATSESVRIDAGFVEGDIISSAYDPMIAKLIVSGPTREIAIRRMFLALQDYEVVGINTNIEFLKRVCQSPDFIAGLVETGYIPKHHDELFADATIAPETYVQAAIGLLSQEISSSPSSLSSTGPHGLTITSVPTTTTRSFSFHPSPATPDSSTITCAVTAKAPTLFDVSISSTDSDLTQTYTDLIATAHDSQLTTFFPHTRLTSTLVSSESGNEVTLFSQGSQTQLTLATPAWYEKALGIKDVTNSVLAPMPCKVLRNEVKEGDKVEKDQPLVVIESMKMETVIRSPVSGIVARLAHKQGDICKAGTVLVLFEEGGDGDKK